LTAKSYSDTFVNILYEEYGKAILSEEEKIIYLHDCYYIYITNDKNILYLNRLYTQKNKNVEIYFEYRITVGNEIIEMIINEKLIYEVEKRTYFSGEIRLD
jgi:hypothetical protein